MNYRFDTLNSHNTIQPWENPGPIQCAATGHVSKTSVSGNLCVVDPCFHNPAENYVERLGGHTMSVGTSLTYTTRLLWRSSGRNGIDCQDLSGI